MVHTLRLDNYYPSPRKLVLGTNSSFGTESIKIERGAGWDGLNLTATWHIPGREEPLRVALLDGDAMDVPPEVTKEAKDGVLVLAGLASGVQRASCNVEYLILEQAGVYGGADAEPTPELAAQVLEAALQAKADAEAAAEDAAKAGPYAEAAWAAQKAAELARNGAIAAQQAAENAAAAAAASKSAADTLAAEAARAAQAAENSKAAANNAAGLAGENVTAAQQAAATAIAAANDAGQIASDAAASKAAAEAEAKTAQNAKTAAAAAKEEAVKAQVAAQTASKSAQDAQAASEKVRDDAKAAQKGAEAARDAAANSAAAAKDSKDAAAKSAADADSTANSINESMTQIAANKEAVSQLKEDLYDVSKNLINNKAMVDGYYTTTTTEPTIKENAGLKCILVKIKGNTVYTLSSVSYSSVFYDANKQKISALEKSNSAFTFTSPSNAKYISISAYNEYAKTVMLVEGNTLPVEFENYKYENAMTIAKKALELTKSIDYKVYHVGVGQEYTNFTNLIKKLDGDATKKIIYIHPGIYDIFAEYGGSSFAKSIADTDWRKWCAVVPPNTRVIGLGRVVFNFLPSRDECTANSISVLSPINTSGSCTIENITINCKNCRCGIHDETSGLSEFYFAEKMFKNVRVYRTANDAGLSSPYGHAYASGFDVGVNVSFENCIFESPSLAWSVHDRVVKNIINNGGIFNLKHSIFKGDSYAGVQFLNNNTDPSETIVNIIDCDVNKLRVEKVSKSSAQKNGYNITSRLCKNIPVITDFDDDNDYPYKAFNVIS